MQFIKSEINLFFTAIMFYTRLPCPAHIDHAEEQLQKSTKYFPFIGIIVGIIGVILLTFSSILFSNTISVLVYISALLLTTGAFHEDGFADVCDGFGGGWNKEKILEIMKDSRLGTYGVSGLLFLMAFKFAFLLEILNHNRLSFEKIALVLIMVQALSRWGAFTTIFMFPYAKADSDSKAKPVAKKFDLTQMLFGTFGGLILVVLCAIWLNYLFLLLPILIFINQYLWARYFSKWIDGYTGDCLGAIQQIGEIICYVFIVILWKYS